MTCGWQEKGTSKPRRAYAPVLTRVPSAFTFTVQIPAAERRGTSHLM